MKLLCFILAIYTLSLSVLPCNDVHDEQQNAIVSASQAQDHHEKDNDICSPFCVCACCQGVAYIISPVTVDFVEIPSSVNHTSYTERTISTSLVSIWQPPRLG